ncbi:3-deoxy-manno-octulosonate cytidylyltransferase (CMP-KDO synthetase) [Aliiroseovarius halocynthiae]|uniref:3-deoxy-manno-octulosonate cytidylyltransferase n=1 Tax=Aliiroseovarius halocynthiae TaxID=985055 RepID=A0A545SNR9_9RHOB|nr:manno-octulosonate cytidylyltransferase [Aliiroseovarius halocynthiae]TQV66638.1 3-deoxy-manno-octulosonate cytidylyltransferase [Aliiroseovarius halocynthiae]SMR82486.1 3-deoxy-manno-octulosonate cytidylyltransferase (CMP-KDO synthetase) [Aliiroseovarius halocynthiae]
MATLIVIPARYASTRYPGKALAPLKGATGQNKTLIHRSWEAAQAVRGVERVVVATDDDRIRVEAEGFGAEVVMTSDSCENGTERCAEVLTALGSDFDIIINLQGDAPLTPPWFVEELVSALKVHPTAEVATPVLRCDGRALNGFLEDRKAGRVGATTAVFGAEGKALYFSKEVIPYTQGNGWSDQDQTPVFHHVGVYAYRPSALAAYPLWPAGPLEQLEGLEQLRFLERDKPVLCVEVEARSRQFWEVNNPEDTPKIEAILQELEIE